MRFLHIIVYICIFQGVSLCFMIRTCEAQIEFLTGLEGGACPVEAGPLLKLCRSFVYEKNIRKHRNISTNGPAKQSTLAVLQCFYQMLFSCSIVFQAVSMWMFPELLFGLILHIWNLDSCSPSTDLMPLNLWNLVIVLIVFGDHKGLILIRECLCQGRLLDASSLHLAKPFVRMPWVALNVSEILTRLKKNRFNLMNCVSMSVLLN